jgi:hypothetical protein
MIDLGRRGRTAENRSGGRRLDLDFGRLLVRGKVVGRKRFVTIPLVILFAGGDPLTPLGTVPHLGLRRHLGIISACVGDDLTPWRKMGKSFLFLLRSILRGSCGS